MRLVVDTNVFVSAALKQASWPGETLRWLASHGGLLKSRATEQEVRAVLARPRLAPKILPSFLSEMEHLLANAELVLVTTRVVACRDAKDDKFLELALDGRADVIVSGDADLLVMGRFRGMEIISPVIFGQAMAR